MSISCGCDDVPMASWCMCEEYAMLHWYGDWGPKRIVIPPNDKVD